MVQCITNITTDQVNEAFIANLPLMQQTIQNLTIQSPNWYRDNLNPTPWPVGEGTIMEQFQFRGELPETEEGFDAWGLVDSPVANCGPLKTDNCSYNMSVLGGHAFTSKITRLMKRDFRTPDYCINAIQNTRQLEEVMAAIVANIYNQLDFQKEVNVGQNFMSTISKKFVIDGNGFKPNPEDVYSFRPKGSATLAPLNIDLLTVLYNILRRSPDAHPYGVANGMPLYAFVGSPEIIAEIQRGDPVIRADIRAAGGEMAKALVERFNFTRTIRDMFIPVPYLTPRRFRWDVTNTRWVRVLPYVKGIKGQVGTFAGINPQYDDPNYATHEVIQVHGANPFSVFYQPTLTTAGQGTDFGPGGQAEPGFWDTLLWVNPQTREDPARREGFFFTTAKIGLSADNSESSYEILVPRRSMSSMVQYLPGNSEVPESASVTNVVPDVGCPVSVVLSVTAHPLTAGRYFVTFAAPIAAVTNDIIQIGTSSGGFVNATVVTAGSDSKTFEVTIAGTVPPVDELISIYTGSHLACNSRVLGYTPVSGDATRLDLVLEHPIKAITNANAVVLKYGNGATQTATLIGAPNLGTNVWRVDVGGTDFVDNVNGVVEICVPTATAAECPGCFAGYVTETQCS